MKSLRLFRFFLAVLFSAPAWSARSPIPNPPSLERDSYYLVDFDSGRVLAEKDPDKHIEPASITKLMTAYLVDKAIADGDIALDEMVTISEKAWRMKGSKMFVEVGKQVSVEDLLKGLIIQSGNDASVALAEHIAGSESAFAGYMNHQAAAARHDQHQFRQRHRLARRKPLQYRARHCDFDARGDPRISGKLPLLQGKANSPSTKSGSSIATGCCGATKPSMASRPAIPRRPATAWSPPRSAATCA